MEMHLQSGLGALPPCAAASAGHPLGKDTAAWLTSCSETWWIMWLIRRSRECRGNSSGKNVGGTQLQAARSLKEIACAGLQWPTCVAYLCGSTVRRHALRAQAARPSLASLMPASSFIEDNTWNIMC